MIKDILLQLDTSVTPVAMVIHKGEHFRLMGIGFKKGMTLKEHKTKIPAKLIVLNGKVNYIEGTKSIELNQYDEYSIPVQVLHSIFCIEDALCLLAQC